MLAAWVRDARQRTLEVVADLTDEQLMGPQLRIVNPLLWEIGHVTWFQEKWALRHAGGEAPIRADGDALYDSAAIPHDTRWSLPLPSRDDTVAYMTTVRDRVLERIGQGKLTEQERSEEHTSELQSLAYLVCRLLLEKKKKKSICSSVDKQVVISAR